MKRMFFAPLAAVRNLRRPCAVDGCRPLVLLAGVLASSLLFSACSQTKRLTGETAFVAPEKARLRSSTAEASRNVGEVKSGDQVTIIERQNEGNTAWANINGPNGVSGWLETRYLVKQEIVDASQKIADEIRSIPAQAIGKSKSSLKLRLSPDRNNDDNVTFTLPAGTLVEIVARERKPRPEKLEALAAKPATAAGNPTAAPTPVVPKFDDWYKVRLKNYSIVPAGWIYGGSVELDIPQDISFFASTDRRITGWQKIGAVNDEQGQPHDTFLVVEKQLAKADERADYDKFKILAYDARRGEYSTPFREEFLGRFPFVSKIEGSRGTFQFTNVDGVTVTFNVELVEGSRAKVVRQASAQ